MSPQFATPTNTTSMAWSIQRDHNHSDLHHLRLCATVIVETTTSASCPEAFPWETTSKGSSSATCHHSHVAFQTSGSKTSAKPLFDEWLTAYWRCTLHRIIAIITLLSISASRWNSFKILSPSTPQASNVLKQKRKKHWLPVRSL